MKGKESSSPARATATQPWRGRGPIGWVINRLAVRCMRVEGSRAADQIIGTAENPYLLRWFILPRNRWFNIYYHVFCRSDDDRALHDHPWWNCSLLLDGEYTEHTIDAGGVHRRRVRQAGEFAVRGAKAAHRIELHAGPCRTLFITGPKLREWGFHCPQGWRHWRIFTSNSGNVSSVGLGCGEMDGAPAMAPSAQGGGMGARAPLAGIADAPPAFTVDQFVTGAGLAAEATRRADLDFSPSLVFMPPDPATDDEIVARFLADPASTSWWQASG